MIISIPCPSLPRYTRVSSVSGMNTNAPTTGPKSFPIPPINTMMQSWMDIIRSIVLDGWMYRTYWA